jgi:hypothetical protein
MKFVLFIEGHTEKALPEFLKRWLDPRLAKPVGIKTVRFDGWQELVKDSPKKAAMHLEGPDKDDIIAVIALIDLYGPTFYPDNMKTADERCNWAKNELEKKVGHPKFYQFFAVHETEAWLLSAPDLFPMEVKTALPAKAANPEKVNFDEPPAKLLERLYDLKTDRRYKKVTHGKELFSRLDPNVAYGKCPRLRELLEKMLELAEGAEE